MAQLFSGVPLAGSLRAAHSAWSNPSTAMFGSYDGYDAMAKSWPLFGSITTADPVVPLLRLPSRLGRARASARPCCTFCSARACTSASIDEHEVVAGPVAAAR